MRLANPICALFVLIASAEEVFSDNSLQSFTHAPVADNHSDEAVNAGNRGKLRE